MRCELTRLPIVRFNDRRTVIGNDVWLGNGVFVRAGVKIGDGAVVGARPVVVSDIPPYAIAAGNPARVKKMWWRFCLYDLSGTRFDRVEEAMDTIEQRIALGTLQEYRPEPFTLQRLRDALAGPTRTATQ